MQFHCKSASDALKQFSVDINVGLSYKQVILSSNKYGANSLTKKKKRTFFSRLIDAFKEPMLLILLFGFVLAFGTGLGKFFKTGEVDFAESVGILFAVFLSVAITVIMEGSSERAFEALNKIYDGNPVKVLRGSNILFIPQNQVVVGDILLLEAGDKIVADCRLIESNSLFTDESALTGESHHAEKDADCILSLSTPLAERKNCVYSGTFVTAGSGKALVYGIGDKTEMGVIATSLTENAQNTPLQAKLSKLGKIITTIGAITAGVVFFVSCIRLALNGGLDFSSIQELFVSSIVLIIAAVPEGLPTIVAVSLALNMIKLAKENALIKKISATETAGGVSVICSDKTGTITQNKMSVVSVCKNKFCVAENRVKESVLLENFVCNSTAELIKKGKKTVSKGSATECALLSCYENSTKQPYSQLRKSVTVLERVPFSSDKKFTSTTVISKNSTRTYIKGAPEVVLKMCSLSAEQQKVIQNDITAEQRKARRVLCFAHIDKRGENNECVYDGFVALADPIRKEVYKAVSDCKRAGIKIKILTGDNFDTAFAIAKELKIATEQSQVINASEIEKMTDEKLKIALEKITVVARSTPAVKLRIVKALKELGEIVAVTGDGVNDAPAVKHADVGIAMGVTGSEITKETADVVLLDDSFATVVRAISFGRNVYKNLQRFILFQLSVNLSALLFVTVCAITGMNAPFNTLQLLWINVIMDGPPALTLGLEKASEKLMDYKPVKRSESIVNAKMLLRIVFNGVFVGVIMYLQYRYNFLRVKASEVRGVIFTLFILFQMFNAFNSRELGSDSLFKSVGKNKVMLATFACVFLVHLFIVEVCYKLFSVSPLSFTAWVKTVLTAVSIIVISELYKWGYRVLNAKKGEKQLKKASGVNKIYFGA